MSCSVNENIESSRIDVQIDKLTQDVNFQDFTNLNSKLFEDRYEYLSQKDGDFNNEDFFKNYLHTDSWDSYIKTHVAKSTELLVSILDKNVQLKELTDEEFHTVWKTARESLKVERIMPRANCIDDWKDCWDRAGGHYDTHVEHCTTELEATGDIPQYGLCAIDATENYMTSATICDDAYDLCD